MPSRNPFPNRKAMLFFLLAACTLPARILRAETCVTQSQMKPAERDAIAASARRFAALVQSNDAASLRQQTLPEYAKDFSGMASLIGATSPKLTGASLLVEQVYLLDASTLKTLADGTNQDAQFFCSLNKTMAEANFLIPALPPGRYAFAMVNASGNKSPERLSFLLKQDAGQEGPWSLAGFYPKPLTAAGHDGIWYWTQARDLARQKQLWAAYLYYQQAQALLQPAGFVSSSHLDKLHKEMAGAAPPALSDGISADTPLVVKGKAGQVSVPDFRFTDLTTDDSLNADRIDIVAHLAPEPAADPRPDTAPSKSDKKPDNKSAAAPPMSPAARNTAAMSALLAAFPELRTLFHGVWIFADAPSQNPFITEQPMANIP